MKWKDKYRSVKKQIQLYCDFLTSDDFAQYTFEDRIKLCAEITRLQQIIKKIEKMPYIDTLEDSNDYEIEMISSFSQICISEEFLLSLRSTSTSTG